MSSNHSSFGRIKKSDIVNRALSKLGSNRLKISNFNTDTGPIATEARLIYDDCIHQLSRLHTWQTLSSWKRLPVHAFKIKFTHPDVYSIDTIYQVVIPFEGQTAIPEYADASASNYSGTRQMKFVNDKWVVYGKADPSAAQVAIMEVSSTDSETPPRSGWSVTDTYKDATVASVEAYRPQSVWQYSYQLPSNCVRVKNVTNTKTANSRVIPNVYYVLDEDSLLSNETDIYICFNRTITLHSLDETGNNYGAGNLTNTAHDSLFMECFVTLLASKLAVPVTGSRELELSLLEEFNTIHLPEARRINGFEQNLPPEVDSEWLEATFTSNSMSQNSLPPFKQSSYGTF